MNLRQFEKSVRNIPRMVAAYEITRDVTVGNFVRTNFSKGEILLYDERTKRLHDKNGYLFDPLTIGMRNLRFDGYRFSIYTI